MLKAVFLIIILFLLMLAVWAISVWPERNLIAQQEEIQTVFTREHPILQSKIDDIKARGVQASPWFFPIKNEGSAVGSNVFYYIVYDETEQITLANNSRSKEWNEEEQKRSHTLTNQRCNSIVKRLEDHYFSLIAAC